MCEYQTRKLQSYKVIDADNYLHYFVKRHAGAITSSVLSIFIYSLDTRNIPSEWKSEWLFQCTKNNARQTYKLKGRSISLLPSLIKLLEQWVFKKAQPYFKLQIYLLEHGFVSGRSTVTQLLYIYNKVSQVLDTCSQVNIIFSDFIKHSTKLATICFYQRPIVWMD